MAKKYERTFTVSVPVQRAWQAFTDPKQREAWLVPPGRDPLENPGIPFPAEGFPRIGIKLDRVEENRLLQWSQGPLVDGRWVETTVTFEQLDTGTRITVTRSGFGDTQEWDFFAQSTGQGWDDSLIDLAAFLETGVNVSRHYDGKSSIGAGFWQSDAGIRILSAAPGGFAAEAGLQAGDLLVSIGGAGVYRRSDVWLIQREHEAGKELDVTYVRDGTLLSGRGRLSEKNYTEVHNSGPA